MEINIMKHNYNKKLDIPQDANSVRYFIPEGYIAKFEDGVLIVEPKKSEDERKRKELIKYLTYRAEITAFIDEDKDCKRWIAFLKRQKSQKDYRKLYEDIAKSKWFKKAYYGKSLGCDEDQKEKKSTATIAVYEEK